MAEIIPRDLYYIKITSTVQNRGEFRHHNSNHRHQGWFKPLSSYEKEIANVRTSLKKIIKELPPHTLSTISPNNIVIKKILSSLLALDIFVSGTIPSRD